MKRFLEIGPDNTATPAPPLLLEQSPSVGTIAERHPDWPARLNVSFYFSAHVNKYDTAGIVPYLKETDVFLYEDVQGNSSFERFLNDISRAPQYPEDFLVQNVQRGTQSIKGSHWEPVIRGLYGAGVTAGAMDLQEYDPKDGLLRQQIMEAQRPTIDRTSYETALASLTSALGKMAELDRPREEAMIRRFEAQVGQILIRRPDLAEKENVKILIMAGGYHTLLRELLEAQGIVPNHDVESLIPVLPYVEELQRTLANGHEPVRELVEKAYTQTIVDSAMKVAISVDQIPSELLLEYTRHIVSALESEQVIKMHDALSEGRLTVDLMNEIMKEVGLSGIPQHLEEILSWKDPAKKSK